MSMCSISISANIQIKYHTASWYLSGDQVCGMLRKHKVLIKNFTHTYKLWNSDFLVGPEDIPKTYCRSKVPNSLDRKTRCSCLSIICNVISRSEDQMKSCQFVMCADPL